MSKSAIQQKKMGLLARMQKKKALQLQRGEMPVGPILVIALIVIPLVLILVIFGDELVKVFKEQTIKVLDGDGGVGEE